jgi:hypothetical protein
MRAPLLGPKKVEALASQGHFFDGVKLSARDKSAKSQVTRHIRSAYPVNDRIGGSRVGKTAGPLPQLPKPRHHATGQDTIVTKWPRRLLKPLQR